MNHEKRAKIAEHIENYMSSRGVEAMTLCNGGTHKGDCVSLAQSIVTEFGGTIVSGLSKEYANDLKGYKTRPMSYNPNKVSHCVVEIEGFFFDAFDPMGVDDETELSWVENL